MSSHNPFRDPTTSSPQPAASSSSLQPSPEDSKHAAAIEQPPPSAASSSSSAPATHVIPPDPTGLTDELPPAYSPGPNVYQGETTVEYGPARPFQPPPPRPQPQAWQPQPQMIRPQTTGWSGAQTHYGSQTPSLLQQITGHLATQLNNVSERLNAQATGQSSWSAYPGQQGQQNHTGYHTPVGSPNTGQPPPLPARPPQSGHAPPSGPPPPQTSHAPTANGQSAPQPPNDGRPTTRATGGHPLLHDGMLLVFPAGYECRKCKNVGYKHNDPLHPCRKCWKKYGKPFTGALAYSSFDRDVPGRASLQRPLPIIQPAPLPQRPPQHHQIQNGNAMIRPFNAPYGVPGNTRVLSAGDPRIGGRLCWRCDGRGTISLLFLEDSCPVCGGIGRLF